MLGSLRRPSLSVPRTLLSLLRAPQPTGDPLPPCPPRPFRSAAGTGCARRGSWRSPTVRGRTHSPRRASSSLRSPLGPLPAPALPPNLTLGDSGEVLAIGGVALTHGTVISPPPPQAPLCRGGHESWLSPLPPTTGAASGGDPLGDHRHDAPPGGGPQPHAPAPPVGR